MIEELGARFGDAPALISARETFSHAELAARANRYARWALAQGIAQRRLSSRCCMPNRADYLALWLGLTRIGGVVALMNTNLTGDGAGALHQGRRPKHVIAAQNCCEFDAAMTTTGEGLAAWRCLSPTWSTALPATRWRRRNSATSR